MSQATRPAGIIIQLTGAVLMFVGVILVLGSVPSWRDVLRLLAAIA